MAYSVLVIGFGSIGKRHSEILSSMDEITNVTILSAQDNLPYKTLSSLEDIHQLNPDYIVIASPTNRHYNELKFLEEHFDGKKILVEKPLFDSMIDFQVLNNEVYVGYNLRFHPLINKVRSLCLNRKFWSMNVFCGSYLPDWRPGSDYRLTSSAQKICGGGVLLDLSHELDYVQWLVGSLEVEYASSKKISDLEIDSDDFLLFTGRSQQCEYVHISLNYLTRTPVRQIILDGDSISLKADLITKTLQATVDSEKLDYSWPNLDRNETYCAQHLSLIGGNKENLCTFQEGLRTMQLIDNIRKWAN